MVMFGSNAFALVSSLSTIFSASARLLERGKRMDCIANILQIFMIHRLGLPGLIVVLPGSKGCSLSSFSLAVVDVSGAFSSASCATMRCFSTVDACLASFDPSQRLRSCWACKRSAPESHSNPVTASFIKALARSLIA